MGEHLEHLALLLWDRLQLDERSLAGARTSYREANRHREDIYETLGVSDSGSPQEAALAEIARLRSAATPVEGTNEQAEAIRQQVFREVAEALRTDLDVSEEEFIASHHGTALKSLGWDGTFAVKPRQEAQPTQEPESTPDPAPEPPLPWAKWEKACGRPGGPSHMAQGIRLADGRHVWVVWHASTRAAELRTSDPSSELAAETLWAGVATSLRDAVRQAVAAHPEIAGLTRAWYDALRAVPEGETRVAVGEWDVCWNAASRNWSGWRNVSTLVVHGHTHVASSFDDAVAAFLAVCPEARKTGEPA